MKTTSVLLTVVICLVSRTWAQDAPPLPEVSSTREPLPFRVAWATRAQRPPRLDGEMTAEDGWDAAPSLRDFKLRNGEESEQAAPTDARLLYDDDALYIAARLDGPGRGALRADATNRDGGVRSDDCLELFLAPRHAPPLQLQRQYERRYFNLTVNASGTQRDAIGYQGVAWWNGHWSARTSVRADGWTVEIRVPFKTLGIEGPRPREAWGLNLCRRYSSPDGRRLSAWTPVEHWYNFPWHFGRLLFGEGRPAEDDLPLTFVRTQLSGELAAGLTGLERARSELKGVPTAQPDRAALSDLLDALASRGEGVRRRIEALARGAVAGALDTIGQDIDGLIAKIQSAHRAAQLMRLRADAPTGGPLVMLGGPAITNDRFLPGKPIPPAFEAIDDLSVIACRGEFEPVTLVLCATTACKGVRVRPTDLRGPEGTMAAGAVDVRVVKYWYQSGDAGYWDQDRLGDWDRVSEPVRLVPELLLKDDGLVVVDHELKRNFIRTGEGLLDISDPAEEFSAEGDPRVQTPRLIDLAPRDADELKPFDLAPDHFKHLLVTVHVPAHARAGTYTGHLHVEVPGGRPLSLPLSVQVLPFDLAPSPIDYSLYYQGRLKEGPLAVPVWSHEKTEVQYRAEMANLLAHGIANPCVPDGRFETFVKAMRIRESVGMPKGHIYSLGQRFDKDEIDFDASHVQAFRQSVQRFVQWAKANGYGSFYVYGLDESDPLLPKQRRWMQAAHDVGAKVFVSVEEDERFLHVVGDLLDLPIMSGPTNPIIADRVHRNGHRLGIYAFPQVDREEPDTFRRNYGVRLWQAGYDVEMTYAYQHSFGHAWNDFDYRGGRKDYNLTYPTVNGVVDTLTFEGLREAVDDTRYFATLLAAAGSAKDDPARRDKADAAEQWIRSVDPQDDLCELRRQVVTRILGLTR